MLEVFYEDAIVCNVPTSAMLKWNFICESHKVLNEANKTIYSHKNQ